MSLRDIAKAPLSHPAIRNVARAVFHTVRSATARIERPMLLRTLDRTPREINPDGGPVVLLWMPEAGVRLHLEPMVVLGRILQQEGVRVLGVRCHELFARCPVMEMHHAPHPTPPDLLESICGECLQSSVHNMPDELPVIDLRAYLSADRRGRIVAALHDPPEDLRNFVYDAIEFGRIALHDLALSKKWSEYDDLDAEERAAWLSQIESCITAYELTDSLCERYDVQRLIYFNDYANMTSVRVAASKRGIGSTTVTQPPHTNIDRQRLQLMPDASRKFLGDQVAQWPAWRELALAPQQIQAGADDMVLKLLNSGLHSHVYSSALSGSSTDLWRDLGLDRGRRTWVAYTSSLDEDNATREYMHAMDLRTEQRVEPFRDQIAWLSRVIHFVETSDDIQLVLRIHPREGVTKRERTASQHLLRLRSAFDRPHANVRIVWPEDSRSSYDLASIADLGLIAWSSIGVECARLGLPVIASTSGIGTYPVGDFVWSAPDAAAYDRLLEAPPTPSLEAVRLAFRWYWSYALGASLSIADAIKHSGYRRKPFPSRVEDGTAIATCALGRTDVRDVNRDRLAGAQGPSAREEETRALLVQLRRLLLVVALGRDVGTAAAELVVSEGLDASDRDRTLVLDGDRVRLAFDGERQTVDAPMIARLGKLVAEAERELSET